MIVIRTIKNGILMKKDELEVFSLIEKQYGAPGVEMLDSLLSSIEEEKKAF